MRVRKRESDNVVGCEYLWAPIIDFETAFLLFLDMGKSNLIHEPKYESVMSIYIENAVAKWSNTH